MGDFDALKDSSDYIDLGKLDKLKKSFPNSFSESPASSSAPSNSSTNTTTENNSDAFAFLGSMAESAGYPMSSSGSSSSSASNSSSEELNRKILDMLDRLAVIENKMIEIERKLKN